MFLLRAYFQQSVVYLVFNIAISGCPLSFLSHKNTSKPYADTVDVETEYHCNLYHTAKSVIVRRRLLKYIRLMALEVFHEESLAFTLEFLLEIVLTFMSFNSRTCIPAKAEPILNSSGCYPLVNFTRPLCQNHGVTLSGLIYRKPKNNGGSMITLIKRTTVMWGLACQK